MFRDMVFKAAVQEMNCSGCWYITGYYTPSEDEFHGKRTPINVKGHKVDNFPSDFQNTVKVEGWGRSRYGWFLGWSKEGGWVKADAPLGAKGKPLQSGSLAVDPKVIPLGTKVRIPDPPAPWDTVVFVANDTGGCIRGKHVDIYCGTGAKAKALSVKLTRFDSRLCVA